MEININKAIKHFENILEENQVSLDQCGEQGVNLLVYENRKCYLELAIAALKRQWETKQKQKEFEEYRDSLFKKTIDVAFSEDEDACGQYCSDCPHRICGKQVT